MTDPSPKPGSQRSPASEAGSFLVLVALPLVFIPAAHAPFADPKLPVLLAGVLLLWRGTVRVDRRLAWAAGAWIAALATTTAFGTDPWWSALGDETRNTGAVALAAAAILLVIGSGLPDELTSRFPTWLRTTGFVVALVMVLGWISPSLIGGERLGLAFGSTLGQPVFVGGFLALGITVTLASSDRFGPRPLVTLAVLASGLAASGNRAGVVGLAVGTGLVVWFRSGERRRLVLPVIVVAVTMALWTAGSQATELDRPSTGVGRATEPGSVNARFAAYNAYLRAWTQDPWLGAGPSLGRKVYLEAATIPELRAATLDWADAHNIVLESLATTGLLGTVPLLVLAGLTIHRVFARRGPPWAAAGAAALVPTLLLQPLDLAVLPITFLVAGVAARPPPQDGWASRRPLRVGTTAFLAVALVLSLLRAGAGIAEKYGRTYDSRVALRVSLTFEPLRLSSRLDFSQIRAFDARQGDREAAADARRLIEEAIALHGWHPRIRLIAASNEILMGEPRRAMDWAREGLTMYPNDARMLNAASVVARQLGDEEAARRFTAEAARIR